MKKNINLIGSSLYSIFLAFELSKDKNLKINIYEKTNNFLNAFSSISVGNNLCNPGFHAFEGVRSTKLLNYIKKNFNIKLKKINKSRGIILDKYIIDPRTSIKKWPEQIIKKFNFENKLTKIRPDEIVKKIDKNYIDYLHINLGDNLELENTLQLIYPWFFPNNYRSSLKDEGSIFLDKIRSKKIKHSYFIPTNGLFESLKLNIIKKLKEKNISIFLKKDITLKKEKNLIAYCEKKKLSGLNILTLPIFSIIPIIDGFKLKLPNIKSQKYYTALIKVNKKSVINNYLEMIVSSSKMKGLRRLSNYSLIRGRKDYIFQLEFVENNYFNNVNLQIFSYIEELKKIIILNNKNNKNIKIKLINYKFLRFIFSPKNKDIQKLSKKISSFFKNTSNIILPREITWPINTNKQYFFSKIDTKMIRKSL
ncbi:hypothetical protein [Candidatus Pelagibacter sp. HIMB1506]|uniref:hypothetical protein n=1 Tax=Candidatus Pelagibacter sp. HIMB1506 TaxID=3413337 RepID=UPI003F85CC5A